MAQDDKQASIWFYSRDLDFTSSLPTSSQGSCSGTPEALKHWAVLLAYMSSKDPCRVNKRILYEANDDGGLLVARDVQHGEDEEDEWRQKSGFFKEDHGMVTVNEARAKFYCEEFNKRKIKYVATKDNCQRFVDEFLANVLTDATMSLPIKLEEIKPWFSGASSTVLNSLSNLGSAALAKDLLIKIANGKGATEMLLKEVVQKVNLNGFGKISILSEGPFKEYMAQEGKQIVLSTFGEVTENLMNASRGAFSWWNLLQIPVELMVGKLMKNMRFTDLQAYGGKKLASCSTAAGVGLLAGGPFGLLGSVAFWIAAEAVATLVNCLLAKIFGEKFTGIFGESETLGLCKSIFRYFKMKIKSGLNASLRWMRDYMESTQNRQKKLA